ncbi:MAG: hypothetical protein PHO93_02845 [Candidatus Saccharimonadaceae bacterium]|nr:hypothetical protein [Candidatus Saccharimonadaceae bacterium]
MQQQTNIFEALMPTEKMRILVACEESQAVCKAFRELGHEAYSCDIVPCSGGHPEWHLQQDVVPLLKETWDLVIAFPPCTDLCVSGSRWFEEKRKDGRQQKSIDFFLLFTKLLCPWAIENPVGIMSTLYRKPDQIINPWQFGNTTNKKTCLWLHNLPLLIPTNIIGISSRTNEIWTGTFDGVKYGWGTDECKKLRSKTFHGIAKAMAEQWGGKPQPHGKANWQISIDDFK